MGSSTILSSKKAGSGARLDLAHGNGALPAIVLRFEAPSFIDVGRSISLNNRDAGDGKESQISSLMNVNLIVCFFRICLS